MKLTKKIKRRIFYEVIWWGAESRHTKCFYSAKKRHTFVELKIMKKNHMTLEELAHTTPIWGGFTPIMSTSPKGQ